MIEDTAIGPTSTGAGAGPPEWPRGSTARPTPCAAGAAGSHPPPSRDQPSLQGSTTSMSATEMRLKDSDDVSSQPARPGNELSVVTWVSWGLNAERATPLPGWPFLKKCSAATYSPTPSPVQYHRRREA